MERFRYWTQRQAGTGNGAVCCPDCPACTECNQQLRLLLLLCGVQLFV